MIHDLVVDCLFEENLRATLQILGNGRLVPDPEDPELPYLTPDDGFLVVRLRDGDPVAFARELERRTQNCRIVTVVDRSPKQKEPRDAGSRQ